MLADEGVNQILKDLALGGQVVPKAETDGREPRGEQITEPFGNIARDFYLDFVIRRCAVGPAPYEGA